MTISRNLHTFSYLRIPIISILWLFIETSLHRHDWGMDSHVEMWLSKKCMPNGSRLNGETQQGLSASAFFLVSLCSIPSCIPYEVYPFRLRKLLWPTIRQVYFREFLYDQSLNIKLGKIRASMIHVGEEIFLFLWTALRKELGIKNQGWKLKQYQNSSSPKGSTSKNHQIRY
jgi:hypothetical protein